jgi:diguanylate cyclase (GGDEF)-like protein
MSRPLTFGVLINEVDGSYSALAMRGLMNAAAEFGVNLLCFPGHRTDHTVAFEREFSVVYRLARQARLDGLVLFSQTFAWSLGEGGLARLLQSLGNLPAVSVGALLDGMSSFSSDHRSGMTALVDHFLHDHGYRRIAFMKGMDGNADADERLAVFIERHQDAGVPLDPDLLLEGRFNPHIAADALDAFLDKHPPCEALIAANDEMALAVIGRALRRGLRIPDQLAVGGYDDVTGHAAVPVPLTSVDPDLPDLTRRGLRHLIDHVTRQVPPVRETGATKLRLRYSCGCRGDDAQQRFGQPWADTQRGEGVVDELDSALRRDLAGTEEPPPPPPPPSPTPTPATDRHDGFGRLLRHKVAQAREQQGGMADLRTALERLSRRLLDEAPQRSRDWERLLSHKLMDAQTLMFMQGQTFQAEDALRRNVRPRGIWWALHHMTRRGAYHIEDVMAPLQEGLLEIGLKHAMLVLYPQPVEVPHWEGFETPPQLDLVLAIVDGQPVPEARLGRFPAEQFLPASPFEQGRGVACSVFPIFLQSLHFGYLVLDVSQRMDTSFEQVRSDVSGVVTNSSLISQLSRARELLHEDLGRQQQANRQLSHLAQRDDMTGLLNRRGFFAGIEQMRGDDPGYDAVLWLIDLDGLKQINDRHGHAAGDRALRAAARVLEEAFRDTDLVARLGGDEFAVFNYPASGEGLHSVELRLQRLLEHHNLHSGEPWAVAFSLGHSLLEARAGGNIDDVLALADRRLYANKRARKAAASKPPGHT